jgi:hypothetical protein
MLCASSAKPLIRKGDCKLEEVTFAVLQLASLGISEFGAEASEYSAVSSRTCSSRVGRRSTTGS